MSQPNESGTCLHFGTNSISVDQGATIHKPSYNIAGTDNTVHISDGVYASNLQLAIDGDHNAIRITSGAHLLNCVILIKGNTGDGNFRGHHNKVLIYDKSNLTNLSLETKGSHNALIVEEGVTITKSSEFYLHGFGCTIQVGRGTSIQSALLAANELETKIVIGNDCLLSDRIIMQTSDSHPIYNYNTLRRTNCAKSILIGNHVWLGARYGVKRRDNPRL